MALDMGSGDMCCHEAKLCGVKDHMDHGACVETTRMAPLADQGATMAAKHGPLGHEPPLGKASDPWAKAAWSCDF